MLMRQIISISLPAVDAQGIKTNATKRGFTSLSSYIKHLYVADKEDLISEDELLQNMQSAHREYKKGKYLTADSVAELL